MLTSYGAFSSCLLKVISVLYLQVLLKKNHEGFCLVKIKVSGRRCKVCKVGCFVSSLECKRIWITNHLGCVFRAHGQSWRQQTATILFATKCSHLASGNDDMVRHSKTIAKQQRAEAGNISESQPSFPALSMTFTTRYAARKKKKIQIPMS